MTETLQVIEDLVSPDLRVEGVVGTTKPDGIAWSGNVVTPLRPRYSTGEGHTSTRVALGL